jgi:hypothetical protein
MQKMSAQAVAPPAVAGGAQGTPESLLIDYSTQQRCALDGRSTATVPNPQQYPYGVGVPANRPVASPVGAAKVQFANSQLSPYAAPAGAAMQSQQVQQVQHTMNPGRMLEDLQNMRNAHTFRASDDDIKALFAMKERTHTRELYLEWNFSEANASENCACTVRKITDDRVFKFSVRDKDTGKKVPVGDLSTGLLLNMRVLEAFSSVRSTIGVSITGVSGRTRTDDGKRFPMVLFHKQRISFKKGRIIHQVTDIEGIHRAERLGHITEESLRSHVAAVPSQVAKDASYLLAASPLFHIIKANQTVLKIDLDNAAHVDGLWYQFEVNAFFLVFPV